jgi:hypothetical protein
MTNLSIKAVRAGALKFEVIIHMVVLQQILGKVASAPTMYHRRMSWYGISNSTQDAGVPI